jgi:hypothetical protein
MTELVDEAHGHFENQKSTISNQKSNTNVFSGNSPLVIIIQLFVWLRKKKKVSHNRETSKSNVYCILRLHWFAVSDPRKTFGYILRICERSVSCGIAPRDVEVRERSILIHVDATSQIE